MSRATRPAFDPSILRSYVGKLQLVPEGMSVGSYVKRNRKASHSRHLPPSELIIAGAPDAQVAHALCHLAKRYLLQHRSEQAIRNVLSDERGFLHLWLHRMDAGTVGGWKADHKWALGFAEDVKGYERRCWRG